MSHDMLTAMVCAIPSKSMPNMSYMHETGLSDFFVIACARDIVHRTSHRDLSTLRTRTAEGRRIDSVLRDTNKAEG